MPTPWITAYNTGVGTSRNDFGPAQLGCKFTVGSSNIIISQLGRWKISGNSQTHTVYILDSLGNIVVSASINLGGGSAGAFVYTSIANTTLTASTVYYIVSSEDLLGDEWYDPAGFAPSTFDTTSATCDNAVYQVGAIGNIINDTWTGQSYVPPNFMIGSGGGGSNIPVKMNSYRQHRNYRKTESGLYVPNHSGIIGRAA